jgi:protein HIRA/HIR1
MQGGRIFSVDQSLQQTTTMNHLETQMAASLSLLSAFEYKFWLQTYVRYLANEGKKYESPFTVNC